jgi:hypothetical protein
MPAINAQAAPSRSLETTLASTGGEQLQKKSSKVAMSGSDFVHGEELFPRRSVSSSGIGHTSGNCSIDMTQLRKLRRLVKTPSTATRIF